MKKLISIFLIITFILVMVVGVKPVQAAEADVEVTFEGPSTIKQEDSEVTFLLKLGKFTGVAEKGVMSFDATLEFSEDLFESVSITGQSGWDISYVESTKKISGLVDEGASNTTIAQFVFKVKDGVTAGSAGSVSLTNFNIADSENLDQIIPTALSKDNITVMETANTNNGNEDDDTTQETTNNQTTGTPEVVDNQRETKENTVVSPANTVPSKGLDEDEMQPNTTPVSTLPKTGLENMIVIAIVVIGITGLGSFIRAKSIKLK